MAGGPAQGWSNPAQGKQAGITYKPPGHCSYNGWAPRNTIAPPPCVRSATGLPPAPAPAPAPPLASAPSTGVANKGEEAAQVALSSDTTGLPRFFASSSSRSRKLRVCHEKWDHPPNQRQLLQPNVHHTRTVHAHVSWALNSRRWLGTCIATAACKCRHAIVVSVSARDKQRHHTDTYGHQRRVWRRFRQVLVVLHK